jgi:hypothetical protein
MNPTQAAPVQPTEVVGKCAHCGLHLTAPMPYHRVWNDPHISVVTVPHEQGVTCAGCGTYHALAVAQYQLSFLLMVAEKPPDASRIVSPLMVIPKNGRIDH